MTKKWDDDWGRNPKLLGPSGCNSSGPGTGSMQSHVMTKHVAGVWLTSDDSDDGDDGDDGDD